MADPFQDILLRYAHVRARAERGVSKDVLDELGKLRDAIKARLVQLDPITEGPTQRVRLRQLLTEIDRLITTARATIQDRLSSGVTELAQTDHAVLSESLADATDTTPSNFSPAVIVGVVGGMAGALALTAQRLKTNLIKALAVDRPESIDDALDGIDNTFDQAGVDLDRVTATTSAQAFNTGLAALYQDAGIMDWHWDARLDSQVCLLCAVLDGSLIGPRDPKPPRHYRCRCVLTPVIPGEERPAFESPANYEQWLERQPEAVQREILGPTRYRLFLADRKKPGFQQGGLSLALTVDNGRIIPVARLKVEWAKLLAFQARREATTRAD